MTDFELAVLNPCSKVFSAVTLSGYCFNLGQSIYRQIEFAGLQRAYNDPIDRHLKMYTNVGFGVCATR